MNGAGSNSANQRLGVSRSDAAFQGATLAFQQSKPSPNAKTASTPTITREHSKDRQPLSRQRTGSELGPEIGTVKDKIGRFTRPQSPANTLTVRGRPSTSSLTSASGIAARLAASKSPARGPSTAPSSAARLGAARSASKAPPSANRSNLPSPAPGRLVHSRNSSLDRTSRDQSIYGRSPSPQSRSTDYQDSRDSSPHPSLGSRHHSQPPDEAIPVIPPRLPPVRQSAQSHGVAATPLRPSTPGAMSSSGLSSGLSNQSHTNSAPSMTDEPKMSEEALSNAIVASSLASARASPSIKVPPPLPPQRRRARSILQLGTSPKGDFSRSPSPPKGMPQTLRGMPKPDSNHRKHRNPLNKHPHKHHEGDRKRWRREVTEKERKRYEGVWASNKGLHIPVGSDNGCGPNSDGTWPAHASDMVLNLVVREIWSRSRLPSTVLERVWDLVDHQNIGLLLREEFVVGMWLIDQQLKGHKLPMKVPESVWDSVRHVVGIRLPLAKGRVYA